MVIKPGRGGARPGAGRKTDQVREQQQSNRATMLRVVTAEDIEAIARAMIAKAKSGDDKAFRAFMSYVLGAPDSELTIKGDANAPLVVEVVYLDSELEPDEPEPAAA
jgi:hypothetical protein